ncbi:MAG: TPMT family class I SAM-dependent methyltransferase [Bacteroidota bacterium]|nr:TPMT family class I SAM-dependent methyltransferase [Bacteroidota bacterium]
MDFPEDYWSERYRQGQTGWDIGYASPPLTTYIDGLQDRDISIFIPGCGRGYEAQYLIEKGFKNIHLLDVSPEVITGLKNRFSEQLGSFIFLHTEDFFSHHGQYDLILEQTFFCAIPPSLRQAYAAKMHELLNPSGKLAGVLFDREFPQKDQPPFGGTRQEYIQYFSPYFYIDKMEKAYNSILPRLGQELFMILSKKR